MKSIRIISPEFELLGEINNYESLIFIRRHYRTGDFELHINLKKHHTDKLKEGNLIMLGLDPHKIGIILYRKIELNNRGQEELIIKGHTLEEVIGRRITVPPAGSGYDRIKDNAESIMKHYVDVNCINTTDINRKFPQLIIAPDLKRGIYTPWQTRYELLDTVIGEIAEYCNMGWEVYLDKQNMKLVFDVVSGRDLTANQDILPPVIFSVDFRNINEQSYIIDMTNYRNVSYAGGQGEDVERLIQQIGDAEGLDRREIFIDCSSVTNIDELISLGQQKSNEFKIVENFESEVLSLGSFIYGQDWDLGDVVTVQNKKWGITMNTRITEVREIIEKSGPKLEISFGNAIPTLISILKRESKKVVR